MTGVSIRGAESPVISEHLLDTAPIIEYMYPERLWSRRKDRTEERPNQRPGYAPPGWPERVRPPESPDWEASAASFLLDCCPADYRAYPVLRRHPVVLARFAAQFVESQVRASAEGLPELRTGLADHVLPEVVQAAVDAWTTEAARLARLRREVGMVEAALRGKVFVPRL